MPSDLLKPPTSIKGESLKEWNRVCTELSTLGRLHDVDRAILVLHCQTWQLNRQAYDTVIKEGQTMTYANGAIGPSPHYKNWEQTTKTLRGTLADLGLTPAARKFVVTEDEPEELL